MRNRQMTMRRSSKQRLLQRGAMFVASATLAAGLPLGGSAVADEPFQVVAVSGQVVCSDYKFPEGLEGSSVKLQTNPQDVFFGPGLTGVVEVFRTDDFHLDFEVVSGEFGVDVFVVKGSADAQQYAYSDATFDMDLTTANIQKIQSVTVCADGLATEFTNRPLPSCNHDDNRDVESKCTEEDDAINAIQFKYAGKSVGNIKKGDRFFCQCGEAFTEQVDEVELPNGSKLKNLDGIGVTQIDENNTLCFSWSYVGGKKECVKP